MTTKHTTIILSALLLASSVITSCKKNILDTVPNDRLSTDYFWKTEADAKLAVNAIYPFLDGTNIFVWDGTSDIGHTNAPFLVEALLEQGVYDALNSRIQTEWSNAYSGIAAANFVLDNIDKVPSTNTALINQFKGEAKALRAYQYIKLAAFYGDIPLVTKSISIEEGRQLIRTPVTQVWDFVDKELTEAASLLP
ncbi:MAG: RagB/SusD family nutrient uptake outer membrane protein, partial [Segetibacter sp.]